MGLSQRSTQTRSRRVVPPAHPVNQAFENKAGRYQLARVEAEMVYYTFTNHHGQQTQAVMPLVTWRRLQERVQTTSDPPKVVVC
ncbi:MAG: hypothetical protein LAP40_00985 [Acidobacteriia bacterium]|nr:hypothetical protein [Terriglobia bacterium]